MRDVIKKNCFLRVLLDINECNVMCDGNDAFAVMNAKGHAQKQQNQTNGIISSEFRL